jgi:hypothetical protein
VGTGTDTKKRGNQVDYHEIARAAAVEALRLRDDEERKRNRKQRFLNTELLLQNYHLLCDHRDNSKNKASDVFSFEELEEAGIHDIVVQAITRSRARTEVMINQIDICLERLKQRQYAKGQGDKYEVLWCLYLDKARKDIEWGQLIQAVAEETPCSESTVRRWKNEMIKELSVLLFGVDGLKLEA